MIYFWKSGVPWYQIWHVQQNFPPTCFQCFLDSLKTNLHREGDKSHSQKVLCILQNAAKTRLQFLLCSKSWPDCFRVFKEPSVGDHHLRRQDRRKAAFLERRRAELDPDSADQRVESSPKREDTTAGLCQEGGAANLPTYKADSGGGTWYTVHGIPVHKGQNVKPQRQNTHQPASQ